MFLYLHFRLPVRSFIVAVAVACWHEVVIWEVEALSIVAYLNWKRMQMDLGDARHRKQSELDLARGTTVRMHSYCFSHGLGDIPDLDVIWNISKKNYIWRVGPAGDRDV